MKKVFKGFTPVKMCGLSPLSSFYFLLFVCCLTGQYNTAKKRLVQLTVISGWHYQNKWYPVVVIDCDSSVISSFFKIVFKFSFEKLFKVIKKKFIKISLIYLLFDLFGNPKI